jgi:hypothetical protein
MLIGATVADMACGSKENAHYYSADAERLRCLILLCFVLGLRQQGSV